MELFLMAGVLIGIAYGILAIVSSVFGGSKVSAKGGFSPFQILLKIAGLDAWKKDEGARFLPDRDLKKILNPNNRGVLIDGKSLRLSDQESFTHNMVVCSYWSR